MRPHGAIPRRLHTPRERAPHSQYTQSCDETEMF